MISRDPEIKEQLHVLRTIVESIVKKYPEVVGLVLHGSTVKGYSNNRSDIDSYFFIENSLAKIPGEKNFDKMISDFSRLNEIKQEIKKQLEFAGLQEKIPDVKLVHISKDRIVEACQNNPNDPAVFMLFYLALNNKINSYRKLVMDTLEKQKMKGELSWKQIMENLRESESFGLEDELARKRKNLYPKTLRDGRNYFLHEF